MHPRLFKDFLGILRGSNQANKGNFNDELAMMKVFEASKYLKSYIIAKGSIGRSASSR